MLLKIIVVCYLFFNSIVLFGQSPDCNRFKTGKFEIENPNNTKSVIKRTKKYQIEKSNGIKLKCKIVWVNDCTYKMIPVYLKDDTGIIGDDILIFEIVETTAHSYTAILLNPDLVSTVAVVYEYGFLGK